MILADINKLPVLGEVMAVPNSQTWDLEKLVVVAFQEDPTTARMMSKDRCVHVFFKSVEEKDNVHLLPNGTKYYTIRTYA